MLRVFGDDFASRFKLLGAAIIAAMSLVTLGFTLVYRVDTSERFREQTVDNCRKIEELKAAITDVFEDGRARLVSRRDELDPNVYRESLAYYDRQLERFKRKECL